MKDDSPFVFAGLWEGWQNPETQEWLRTGTIITGQPNEMVAEIHTRMPVIHRMHTQFKQVQESAEYKQKQHSLSTNDFIIYLLSGPPCLYFIWCGLLYTVVEGYQELKLTDSQVNSLLLQSTRLAVLKRCRNGMFHFQKDYFDDRLIARMRDLFFTTWALELTKALGGCITNALQAKGPIPPPQLDLSQFL
jgi:hypothetical protein